MPKEYSQWLSELTNSIEDNNTWTGQCLNIYAGNFTDMQKRMMFADIIEPEWHLYPDTWLKILCLVDIDYHNKREVLGEEMYLEYINTNSTKFVERLRIRIKEGWKP